MSDGKIITAERFSALREDLRQGEKRVVMCHGVYDLLHYGHVEHLKEAKSFGDVLVVSVTAAPFVNKGPDRPYFNDEQRLEFLASIEYVDYVMLSNEPTALTNIAAVRPDVYVKGQEFRSGTDGVTGHVAHEIEAVERFGGTVRYTQGEVFSSSKLLNNYFGALPKGVAEFSRKLTAAYGETVFDSIADAVEGFKKLRVLVVGDIIIDDYIFCVTQGLTSKDAAMSTRFQSVERYLGGALAVARHVANFCPRTEFLSMMGPEKDIRQLVEQGMPEHVKLHLLRDNAFETAVKRRYLKRHPQRGDSEKLFSINYLNETENLRAIDYRPFHHILEELLPEYDLVILCDYGHGLIDGEAAERVERFSNYLAVNCQTNSSNYGMNIITKYGHADTFALDEKELDLAFRERWTDKLELLERLRVHLNAQIGWLTTGAEGAIAKSGGKDAVAVPALTLRVTDTVGAGDAFFALSSLCAAASVPADIATLVANAAGAIKTHMLGNMGSVQKKDLLKFVKTVLNV